MSPRQLKALIQTGHYRLEPALVAEAMLERPGFRAFLLGERGRVMTAGRSHGAEPRGSRAH